MAFRRPKPAAQTDGAVAANLREALHRVLAGDLAGAELVLARAARLDSSSIDLYMALANVYRARGEVGRAIHIHQNLLLRRELEADLRRESLLGLALDFRAGGFLKRAAASFRELLEHDPNHLDALVELERIHVETGDWDEAIQTRRRIGARDPDTDRVRAHLFVGLGRAHAQGGRASEAQKAFRRAIACDKQCAEALIAFGDLRMQEEKPAKAVGLWRRALPLHPRIGVILYPKLWVAHEREGELPALRDLLATRRDEDPADEEATLWWARTSLRLGDTENALASLRLLLDRQPDYFPAYAELGRALLGAGREAESAKAFEELLAHLPPAPRKLRCKSCGTADNKLHWRCPQCGEWDSFV